MAQHREEVEKHLQESDLELKSEYERTRLILETTLDGYILANTSGQLLDVNPAYCKLIGYTRDDLLCMNIRQLEASLSDDEVNARIQSMLAAGGARFETRHRHKNGHQVELDVNIAIMHAHETPLMAAFVRDITERNKADANLHYRLRLEAALAKVSSNLMQANEEKMDSAIDKALEHIGTAVDADRSYFFQIDDASQNFSNTHEWCAEGIEAQQPELQQVLKEEFHAAFTLFKEGTVLHMPAPHEQNVELAPLREHMQQTGIRSLINVPVLWEGQLRGVIGFDSERTDKIWPEEDIQLLQTVADNFGSAMARQESSQRIREHTWFLESLDKTSKLLTGLTDATLLLHNLTALILDIFDVDRAWLLRPCNPQAPTFQIPIESTRPEFPGAATEDAEIPMDEFTAEIIRQSLEVELPVTCQCKDVIPLLEYAEMYQIQSVMAIVLHPQIGDPWLLGVHQCAYQREWSRLELQLFQTIAERVTSALSGKLLLEHVQASERRMLEAEQIAQMGEWELNIATGQAKWTDQIHHILGTDPSQEVGPAFLSTVVNPDDWPGVSASLKAAMEKGEKHEMEYRVYRPSGEERWLYCKAHRDLDENGKPIKLTGIAQDITERKQAEIYLRESEARYRAVFNQQFQFMAILSPDGTTLDINELPLRMIGCKREDIVGKPFWQSPAWKNLPEWQEIWKKRLTEAANLNGPVITEDIYQTADGSIRQADYATTAIRNDKDELVFYLVQASDTTDRRRTEQERSKLMQEIQQFNEDLEQRVHERTSELEAVNKELESFSYSVSHDLRTPLRAIDGFSLALVEDYGDQLDGTAHDYLQRVRNGAQRMGILIDDLLQLSRVNRGELIRKEVDLGKIAEAVLAELQAGEPDRQVELILDSNMQVKGDPRLLRVILDNLLGNAWKFTAREAVSHITLKHKTGQPGVFYISDNGVGFDMRHADKLFGAFQRLHRTIEFPGTGVGLATVQRIIHRHGGRVWAEAREGEGASFYFTLGPM